MKNLVITGLLLWLTVVASAQKKWGYGGGFGTVFGANGTDMYMQVQSLYSLSTVHKVGISAGLHQYQMRSIPIMALWQIQHSQKKRKPYIQACFGVNLPALKSYEKSTRYDFPISIGPGPYSIETATYKPGIAGNISLGCQLFSEVRQALSIEVGYGVKTQPEFDKTWVYNGTTSEQITQQNNYIFRTWQLTLMYTFR
jgi:hypothetical protein